MFFCLRKFKDLYFSRISDKAPVSKGLMGCMFLTCTALNMPLLAHLRKYLVCKLPDVFQNGEVTNYISGWSKIFLCMSDLIDPVKDLIHCRISISISQYEINNNFLRSIFFLSRYGVWRLLDLHSLKPRIGSVALSFFTI